MPSSHSRAPGEADRGGRASRTDPQKGGRRPSGSLLVLTLVRDDEPVEAPAGSKSADWKSAAAVRAASDAAGMRSVSAATGSAPPRRATNSSVARRAPVEEPREQDTEMHDVEEL